MPKFKVGDIIRLKNLEELDYVILAEIVYVGEREYKIRSIQERDEGCMITNVGLTFQRSIRTTDQCFTLDSEYIACRQFDLDLKALLEE